MGKIEGHQQQLFGVDDEHLAVIADKVVGSARHRNSALQRPHLEPPQNLVAAAVCIGNQRLDRNPAFDRLKQCLLNLRTIHPENEDLDTFLRPSVALQESAQDRLPVAQKASRGFLTEAHSAPHLIPCPSNKDAS